MGRGARHSRAERGLPQTKPSNSSTRSKASIRNPSGTFEPTWESHLGPSDPAFHYTSTDETPLDATHIGQRLNALIRALDNLPHQARRLVRWQVKRDAALKASKPTRISPMRPGLPPGWRRAQNSRDRRCASRMSWFGQ